MDLVWFKLKISMFSTAVVYNPISVKRSNRRFDLTNMEVKTVFFLDFDDDILIDEGDLKSNYIDEEALRNGLASGHIIPSG